MHNIIYNVVCCEKELWYYSQWSLSKTSRNPACTSTLKGRGFLLQPTFKRELVISSIRCC